MEAAIWSDRYIGIPWAEHGRSRLGVDCWGLAWLVYSDLGIAVPSYVGDYADATERAEIAGLIGGAKTVDTWRMVDVAAPFDLVVFHRAGIECHVGIVVSPGLMLHVIRDRDSHLARYDSGYWSGRLTGTWRHRDL